MSLIDVELKSYRLKSQLAKPHSAKFKLLYISHFLENLFKQNQNEKYLSYFLELEPEFINLILNYESLSSSKFDFFSPKEIGVIKSIINYLIDIKQFESEIEKLGKCRIILKKAEDKINSILINPPHNGINYNLLSSQDSLNIVLVETNNGEESNVGTIQKFHIGASKRGREFKEDKIDFDGLAGDENIRSNIGEIIAQSKSDAGGIGLTLSNYNFSYFLECKNCSYTGPSFGAALGALTYNSILINELYKKYYSFYDDVVITGAVDGKGNLIKMDYETLKTKLNTVFFSPFTKFVIPEDNILEAKNELQKLLAEYPNRNLKLIPLRKFKDVFSNLEIVEVKKLKLREKLKVNYKKYHTFTNSALSIIIISILIFLTINFIVPELDRNPVYTDLKDNRYVAYNKYGKAVWRSNILSGSDISGYKTSIELGIIRILLADLEDDGFNDILVIFHSDKDRLLNRTLFCYNNDGSIKWKTILPQKDSLYGNDYCSDDITARMIYILNKKGDKEIFVNYRICILFPDFTAKINAKGKIVSEFYNPGSTIISNSADIDNDGIKELISTGINNDFDKSGALIVSNPGFFEGCAPGYRFPRNYSRGLMEYYLLFPKTDIGKFSNHGSRYVGKVEIHNDDRIFVYLQEMDSFSDKNNGIYFKIYTLMYTFDKSFNVLHVETSSEFDARYQQLVNEGKLKPVQDWKKYKEKLKSQVRWWDGDKFVNYPTMNKYYLLAKANQDSITTLKSDFPNN